MATLRVFSIFDVKVGAYMQPFFLRTVGEAERAFEGLLLDGNSMISRHPADFTLFEIGQFDEARGALQAHETPRSVITALEMRARGAGDAIDQAATTSLSQLRAAFEPPKAKAKR